jgi:hypothetical protein
LNAYNNSYTATSVAAFSQNPALLRKPTDYVKPEQVKAFELGYRSFIEGFSVDVNGITIYTMTSLGILMWLLLYMVPLKILQVVFQALTLDFSLFCLANSNFRALYTTKVEIKSLGFRSF